LVEALICPGWLSEPEQAKALLAILIGELRVNSRNEILPTYRVGAPVVCAPNSSGASRARTDDLRHAMAALFQLSYSPKSPYPIDFSTRGSRWFGRLRRG
jgi:hypothetical protein